MTSTAEPGADADHPGQRLNEQIEHLQRAIWNRRPVLGEIMRKHGDEFLYDYSQDFLDVHEFPLLDARKHELIDTVRELLVPRLGATVAEGVARQLRKLSLVSTTDHHGPIDHPFFVNANIISAIPFQSQRGPAYRYLPVFSFASVSVNNASAYPRGILFHGGAAGEGPLIRLPILPDKVKMGVVYGMRPFTRADLDRAEQELAKREQNGEVHAQRAVQVRQALETYFAAPDVLGAPDLATQITKVNFRLWPRLFHRPPSAISPPAGSPVPDLVYLEIETIVTELLLRRHLGNPQSPFYKLFFDQTFQGLALKHFNNLAGGFSLESDWGTYLFWAVDDKRRRVRLKIEDNTLASFDASLVFDLTPEDIVRLLREKRIFPSMLLCYLMVAMYYGMKCLGGFSQVHDLTMVKEAWSRFLADIGDEQQASALQPLQTKELGGDGMVLAYVETAVGTVAPATGIDMLLDPGDTSYSQFLARSKTVTLSDMMTPMLPEMYTVLYSEPDRNPALSLVTSEQIIQSTGLYRKIARPSPEARPVQISEAVGGAEVQIDTEHMVPVSRQAS